MFFSLKRKLLRLIATSIIVIGSSASIFAQLGTSNVTGSVADITGAAIAGATITISNKATGQTREVSSNEEGVFVIQNLPAALYSVKVNAAGFSSAVIDNFLVRVGETVNFISKLQASAVEDVIEVNASDVQGVDTTTSQVSAFINDSTLATLPLNGRNFLDLAFLLPGNVPAPVFDASKNNSIQVSSAGQLGRGGNLAIDGADNNDDAVGGILQNFPQDSVKEFQIITNRFSAEIGRSGSSAINVITKNGTNELHGSGGIFLRDESLSAIPATLDKTLIKTLGKPPFDRQQYTGSLGGPIVRDKAWFFGSFEYRNQDSILITGLRDLARQTIVTNFTPVKLDNTLFVGRVDYQASVKDRLVFRYGFEDLSSLEGALPQRPIVDSQHLQVADNVFNSFVVNHVHTFSPNLLNDFTFQENNYRNKLSNPGSATSELLFPSINVGNSFVVPGQIKQNRVQLRNNLSFLSGKHAFKFGGEYHRIDTTIGVDLFGQGNIFLAEDFASIDRNGDRVINDRDIPILFTFVGNTQEKNLLFDNDYSTVYFQDDWKIASNFTLNLGIRYELESDSTNKSHFKTLNPVLKPFLSGNRDRDKDNISPRIGFNWDPTRDGRTSIHGGYGIYYERIPLNSIEIERRNDGLNALIQLRLGSDLDTDGTFLPGTVTLDNPFDGFPVVSSLFGFIINDNNLEHPVVQQFNFGIKREIVRDLVVSIDGIHAFGTKFLIVRPIGVVEDPMAGPTGVNLAESSTKNWYDGLLINVEKRQSKGFGFIASYTLSKSMNFANDDQFPFAGIFQPLADPNNIGAEKGYAPNDQRHRFTFAGLLELPKGITVSPIFVLASDVPFDIAVPDGSRRIPLLQRNAGGRQFRTGKELNAFIRQINSGGGLDGFGPLPFISDDFKFGDTFNTFDLRIAKTFKISERVSLQAIGEVFNLFNVTNIRGLSNTSFSGFQNALVRDSEDPANPGFLKSSNFGTPFQTAGGALGSGGPRAFQFAFRLSF